MLIRNRIYVAKDFLFEIATNDVLHTLVLPVYIKSMKLKLPLIDQPEELTLYQLTWRISCISNSGNKHHSHFN